MANINKKTEKYSYRYKKLGFIYQKRQFAINSSVCFPTKSLNFPLYLLWILRVMVGSRQGEYPLFQTASLSAIKDDENNEAYGVMSVTFDTTPYKSVIIEQEDIKP